MNSTIQKIEGGRASFAYEKVKQAIQNLHNLDDIKLYASYLKRLPSMIHVNGLGQAMAFYYIKSDKKSGKQYQFILDAITEWLHTKSDLKLDPGKHLLESIVNLNSADYRRVTSETLAFLNWMRKFADGMQVQKEAGTKQRNESEEEERNEGEKP